MTPAGLWPALFHALPGFLPELRLLSQSAAGLNWLSARMNIYGFIISYPEEAFLQKSDFQGGSRKMHFPAPPTRDQEVVRL
jgi:hypothetical protein